ncbi:MAG TPA: SIS domain-containing protein [Steroidobacteraceae bacterium]|nr:SIS domain-containing protein [Steroidobacteraceae bacterium]
MSQALPTFLEQIRCLPELLPRLVEAIEPRARQVLTTPDIYGIRQIVLTGSGDSYIAAESAASALRTWTGLPVQALKAMDAARYLTQGIKTHSERLRGTLVVCVSHSGEAARVVEAAQRTRAAGAQTLALTAHPDSRLGRAAANVLALAVPDAGAVPGTSSYCASLLGLYLLGIRLAEVRLCISMDTANALRSALTQLQAPMAHAIGICEEPLMARAQAWAHCRVADILGSGPSGGAAAYSAAKLIEATGIHAVSQDIEEFFHLNYFVADPTEVATLVFAGAGSAGSSRARELCRTLQDLGRPFLLLTDDATFGPPEHSLVLPVVPEWLSPLLAVIPATLLAALWADRIGADYFRGHSGRWRASQSGALVRGSTIEPLLKEE